MRYEYRIETVQIDKAGRLVLTGGLRIAAVLSQQPAEDPSSWELLVLTEKKIGGPEF
jgi:hypothetical protein